MEGLQLLLAMLADGSFHHATYRCQGSLWEGLWIYRKVVSGDAGTYVNGRFGFEPAASIPKASPHLDAAYAALKAAGHGTSLGAWGEG